MTFKVGDRVVGNGRGHSHRIGNIGTIVGLSKIQAHVLWDDTDLAAYVNIGGIDLAPLIGKPITELNLKPGDVVAATDGVFSKYGEFTVIQVLTCYSYPHFDMYNPTFGIGDFGPNDDLWKIVSRAAETKPPRKMHPDDFVNAVSEFAKDNGYGMSKLDFYGLDFDGYTRPRHTYSV